MDNPEQDIDIQWQDLGLAQRNYKEEKKMKKLRDKFAMAALTGFLANPDHTRQSYYTREGLVCECFTIADAMLAERDKNQELKK